MIKFWNFIESMEDDSAELLLYGEICSDEPWFTEDYVAYRQFVQELNGISANTIHLRINSPGGEVMAANAIFNRLKDCGKTVVAHIDGMCASAATIPLMAAEKVIASCNAVILIHDPLVCLSGYYNAGDLAEATALCETIKESIIATYRSRLKNIPEEELGALMSEERWLTAAEAQDMGLVDEVAYSDISDIQDQGKYLVVNAVRIKKELFSKLPAIRRRDVQIQDIKNNETGKGGRRCMDEESEIKSAEDLMERYPELCHTIREAAVNEERNRMKALDELGDAIPRELVEQAKYGKPMDAKELAFQALVAEKRVGEDYLGRLKDDASESKSGAVPAAPEAEDAALAGNPAADNAGGKEKTTGLVNALNADRRRRDGQ